jgi:hypothetical protein
VVTVCTTRFNILGGHRGLLSPALKRPGREANCWPTSSAEIKDDELYLYSHVRPYGMYRQNVTFTFLYLPGLTFKKSTLCMLIASVGFARLSEQTAFFYTALTDWFL